MTRQNALDAGQCLASESPDAIILDINLPGLDGLSLCRAIRPDFKGPILILTARGDEVDEVVGLEVGADDYLANPVRPRVLLARLRALLRRANGPGNQPSVGRITTGSMVVDAGRRVVELNGREPGTNRGGPSEYRATAFG